MIKKLFYSLAVCAAILFTQSTNAAALETPQSFQVAVVELDAEFRNKANLPFLRDENNNPLTNKSGEEKTKTLIGQVIGIALQFLVGIAVIFIILNSFKFITANGDDSKLSEAKKSLLILIGGLLIIFFSYSIVSFVFKTVLFVEELDPIIEVQDTTQAPQSGGGQASSSGT